MEDHNSKKRPHPDDDGDVGPQPQQQVDDDDDYGPSLPVEVGAPPAAKKRKTLAFQKLYLAMLPSAERYEKSYMHRDVVTHVAVSKTEFILTASVDGQVKFWKKQPVGVEFVKHIRAHLGPITSFTVSHDGTLLASTSLDRTIKFYDVVSFDMMHMHQLDFTPSSSEWIYQTTLSKPIIAVGSKDDNKIRIFDSSDMKRNEQGKAIPMAILDKIHRAPVHLIKFNREYNTVVSVDTKGMVEYWDAETYNLPENIEFKRKSDTDLYEFPKAKSVPRSLAVSEDGKYFSTMSSDNQIRVFKFATGKIYRKYDESLDVYKHLQMDQASPYKMEAIDFGRRMAIETQLAQAENAPATSVIFDQSGNFILYPCMLGIKLVNLKTNKLELVIGREENSERYLQLALFQGRTTGSASMGNLTVNADYDPTLICCAWKKNRFYMFTRRKPDESIDDSGDIRNRDVFNEKPTREEIAAAVPMAKKSDKRASTGVIHTTMGDIHFKLFREECPKTVENFSMHSKNGYYNNLIFHRVIKSFMVQTGDPLGDGTGGESIWGHDFEDEFHPKLKHDVPFTLSMANAGANTNGSQFFITTVPLPHLDNKHTVFGRVTRGFEVVRALENVKTDKRNDKPFEDVKIVNIEVNFDY